ncbi:MAG: hypothetical protein M3511_03705 [Deinococcota bacterium]|nr:hypothetical protein [Deinococcota bacterium]
MAGAAKLGASAALVAVLVTFAVTFAHTASAQCRNWSEGVSVGRLDTAKLPEASGVATSRTFPGRLYHVNDSGDGPFFYMTDLHGGNTETVRIEGFDAKDADVEALGIGPCRVGSCLFIGDIGDNHSTRESVRVLVVEEKRDYGGAVRPLQALTLIYPDGPHDAEGMAVHPNGDLYIVTKERLPELRVSPVKLFRLERDGWEGGGDEAHTLSLVSEIDFRRLITSPLDVLSLVPTALDIAPDGSRVLILTYGNAYEFYTDLATSSIGATAELKAGYDYATITLRRLPQQESISYLPDGRSFIYTTESRGGKAELVRVDCLD